MRRSISLSLAVLATLIAGSVSAAQQASAVYTFVCNGTEGEGPCPNGGNPTSLILGSDGNFYGTAGFTQGYEGGLIFSLTPSGDYTVLYTFVSEQNSPTGNGPLNLMEGPDGMLYGATNIGGANNEGTLFRLNRDGSAFQVIHSFCVTPCNDGYNPTGMVSGTDGNVYGTTVAGGSCHVGSGGTIFQVNTATGAYKTVKCLKPSPSKMAVGSDGTFYGTVADGMFHYDEATNKLTTTHLTFNKHRALPVLPVFGANGNLYGFYENAEKGVGIFEVEPDGSNLQAFPFISNFPLLEFDFSPLILGGDGNLWMTRYNSPFGQGEILEFSPTNGTIVQTLSPFSQTGPIGGCPVDLISTGNGSFWGLSQCYGQAPQGSYSDGVVFSVSGAEADRR